MCSHCRASEGEGARWVAVAVSSEGLWRRDSSGWFPVMPPKRRVLPLCSGLTLLLEFAVHLAALAGPEAGPICVGLSSGGPNPVVRPSWRESPCFHAGFPGLGFAPFLCGADFFSPAWAKKYFWAFLSPQTAF